MIQKMKDRLARLRPSTLKGRYLLLVSVLGAVCLVVALWATNQVLDVKGRSSADIAARQAANQRLRALQSSITRLDSLMRAYLLVPSPARRERVRRIQGEAAARLEALAADPWFAVRAEAAAPLAGLVQGWRSVSGLVPRLVQLRVDTEALYPATVIFRDEMTPANRAYFAAATRMLDEARELTAQDPRQAEVARVAADLRQSWSLMIGAFRNLVANRSGIFDEPLRGMRGQQTNIHIYRDTLEAGLARLHAWQRAGVLSLGQEEAVEEMTAMQARWFTGYRQAMAILTSSRWRTDLPIFEEAFVPQMAALNQAIEELDRLLERAAANQVTELSRTSGLLLWLIWGVAVAGLVVMLAGYLLFERGLLRPVARVAAALDSGAPPSQLQRLPALAGEARRLVEAWKGMADRVRTRQARLSYIAHHDALTGLPNRYLVLDRLRHAVARAERSASRLAVLFLDLNDFKVINDDLGHEAGDRVLKAVAQRITACVRKDDTVGRLGGDEFVVILEGIGDSAPVVAVAEKIQRTLEVPCVAAGQRLIVGASIGIALYPDDAANAADLLKRADLAMYQSKKTGADYSLSSEVN